MKKLIALFMTLCLLAAVFPAPVPAEEAQPDAAASADAAVPQDDLVTTSHTATINGQELAYTATAGTMVVTTGGKTCEFFFRAYTLDGVEDVGSRPVTFAFNGGPGSCSYYIEMGCLGPRRAKISKNGRTLSLPSKLVDNENSLLDISDLVFIDAVGTGYSRPVGDSELSDFTSYDSDIRSFGDFIRQYIDRYGRWGSEKYIAGESYGTVRAVGLCKYLSDTYSMNVNGLILVSSINDFSTAVPSVNNELPYAVYFPTYAADAWYHKLVDEKYQDMALEDYMDEVRSFVSDEYIDALFQGSRLTDKEKDKLAEKISSYIGLSKDFILSKNLRITLEDFCANLMGSQNLMIGRDDGRYTGPITSGSLDSGDSDPSSIESSLIFGNCFYQYITEELNFHSDLPYVPSNEAVNDNWTSPAPEYGWIGGHFCQEEIVYECLSKNPYLKIWVICGYYDGATPFYAAEWTYAHVFLNDESKDNLSFTYYPSGHMFYLEKSSFDQFRKDAQNWYANTKEV